MAGSRKIVESVYAVGVIDWDRRLFDALIPLPDGTTYNAYMIVGSEKTALIDTADPAFTRDFLQNIDSMGVQNIDYIVANHAEQDHSGSLPALVAKFPKATIITNQKCKDMLVELMPDLVAAAFLIVADKQEVSLGNKTLQFHLAPWVHWPETMFTFLKEDKILFTCDFLGAHFAGSETFVVDEAKIYEDAKRYYAEIMMPFRVNVRKHLELLKTLEYKYIAPSHGPVYDKPQFIVDAYADWSSENVKNEVVIAFVTMHESTKEMARFLGSELMKRNIPVKEIDLAVADLGKIAMELVDAATLVLGSPTVLAGAHPAAAYAAYLANAIRPKLKHVAIIGSYSWGGKMLEQLSGLISGLKVEALPAVVIKGTPKAPDYAALTALAESIAQKHACLNSPK